MAQGLSLSPAEKADAQQAKAKILIREADGSSGPISVLLIYGFKNYGD